MNPLRCQQPLPIFFLSLLTLVSSLAGTAAAAFENDFSAYPAGAQRCLYDSATTSGCTGNTGTEMNMCLCRNQGNFVYNTASCVAIQSPRDLESVFATIRNNCEGTGVFLAVGKEAFMAAAAAMTATATTSAAPSTRTSSTLVSTVSIPTSTVNSSTSSETTAANASGSPASLPGIPLSAPTQESPGRNNSLPMSAQIGIGVGVAFGAIALSLAAWFIYAYSRRRRPGGSKAASDSSESSFGDIKPSNWYHAHWPNNHQPLPSSASTTFSAAGTTVASEWPRVAGSGHAYVHGGGHSRQGSDYRANTMPTEPVELDNADRQLAELDYANVKAAEPVELSAEPAQVSNNDNNNNSEAVYHGGGGSGGFGLHHNGHAHTGEDSPSVSGYPPSIIWSPATATPGNPSYVSPQTVVSTPFPRDGDGVYDTWATFSSSQYSSDHFSAQQQLQQQQQQQQKQQQQHPPSSF
ncbi:nuclear fusion protein [Microdochium nivale]|nr:nuclear fusion protein [Microdochium nivale]